MKINRVKIDADYATIILKGDEHVGHKQFDKDLHFKTLDEILEKNYYVIGMGDNLETATRDSVGAAVFEQDQIVEEQIETYVNSNQALADAGLILGLHTGNHEARVYNHSGTNLTRIMSKMLNVPYLGAGVVHYIQVGRQNYVMYSTHGSSGSKLPHTKIRACIELSNMVDAEIYAMGHTHQLSHHVRQYYSVDKKKKILKEEEKHFVLTGAYLSHWGSYGQEKGYEMMRKGSPAVKLGGIEKEIAVTLR